MAVDLADDHLVRIVYTPREVKRLLGVSLATVYRRMADGSIPTVQMGGGRLLIPKAPFDQMFGL